jgi:hypothetical protein
MVNGYKTLEEALCKWLSKKFLINCESYMSYIKLYKRVSEFEFQLLNLILFNLNFIP